MSPKLRFYILSRDRFTCRYCGRKSPEVTLHVDHVFPVSAGGTDTEDNLVAACVDCNQGKRDTVLPSAFPVQQPVPLKNTPPLLTVTTAMWAWNPGTAEVIVVPWPDTKDLSREYVYTEGACTDFVHTLTSRQRAKFVLYQALRLCTAYKCDPLAVNREFLTIREYHNALTGKAQDIPHA